MSFNLFRKYYTDGTDLNLGVGGDKISTDDLGNGMKVQRVKMQYGDDGFATDVSTTNPLPVLLPAGLATSGKQDAQTADLDALVAKDFATQATLALIKAKTDNLDLAITGLRDALRGLSNKTLTDLDTDLGALHTDLGTVHSDLITLLTTSDFDTKTGSLTEAAPATDTASSGLNGRLQRVSQRLTSLIALLPTALDGSGFLKTHEQGTAATSVADGSNVVEGAVADAIVAAGATGSISAKLRRVTQGLEDLKSLIVLAVGDNIIGRVKLSDGTLLLSLLNSAPVSDTGQVSIPVRIISSLATLGGGTQYTEDAVSAADPIGNMTILRRRDSLVTTEVSTDGDNIAANSTNRGELYIRAADISVSGNITTPDVAGGTPDGNGTPITTTPTANSAVFAQVSGYSAFSIFLSGTLGSSTYYVEGSSNSTTGTDGSWVTISEKVEGSITPSSGFTILASKLVRGNCAGLSYIRLRAIGGSAINSTVVIRLSIGQPGLDIIRGLPAGTNVIGGITSTDLGTSADSSATTDTGNFSQISLIKRLLTKTPALGQTTMANSQPITIASDQSALPITDNAGSLTVDAPVGTPVFVRLSDGSAAFLGQKAMASSLPVAISSDQGAIAITPPTLTKGTQGANGISTQDLKDSGRVAICLTAEFTFAQTAETLLTMTESRDGAATGTFTSKLITSGKRLRIVAIYIEVESLGSGTAPQRAYLRLRVNTAGATTASSPIQGVWSCVNSTAIVKSGTQADFVIPDGVEYLGDGTKTYGFTLTTPDWVTSTATGAAKITVLAFEY